jgi:hypothetical protein
MLGLSVQRMLVVLASLDFDLRLFSIVARLLR